MLWVRQTLTTGESDPENAPGYAVGLLVAWCFAAEPPLRNRTEHLICNGLSCRNQEVEEKNVPAVLNAFCRVQKSLSAKESPLCIKTRGGFAVKCFEKACRMNEE
jgi:hypothetical protein